MEISLAVQMQGFILATVAGFALAILYDALKMVRTMIRSTPSHVFWMDLAFMAVAGIVTFLLALAASYGEVRFYLLAGEGIGFCLYFMTFGLISSRVVRFVRKILDFCLFRPLKCIFHALARWIRRKAQWIEGKVKKSYAKRKKRLKPRRKIVYNDANKSNGKKNKRQKGRKGGRNQDYESPQTKKTAGKPTP